MLERLQKIISQAGIASRRHAEQLILSGQVTVNGEIVTTLGAKADLERDRVEAGGKVAERPTSSNSYILYKPPHVVATMSDPEGRATLRHLLRGLNAAVFPVGRLDYAASGLVLLTSDGKLADRIFKAASRLPKVYWLKVKGRPMEDTLYKIRHAAHAKLRRLAGPAAAREHSAENPWYEAEVSDARGDMLRDALFAAGHPVEKLKRVRIGPLDLGDLREGHFRQLAPSEVAKLIRAVERAEKAPRPVHKRSGPNAHQRLRAANQYRNREQAGAGQGNRGQSTRDQASREVNGGQRSRNEGDRNQGNRNQANRNSANRSGGSRDQGNRKSANRSAGSRESSNRGRGNRESGNRGGGKGRHGARDHRKSGAKRSPHGHHGKHPR